MQRYLAALLLLCTTCIHGQQSSFLQTVTPPSPTSSTSGQQTNPPSDSNPANKIYNAALFPGSDIGAKVNAAFDACAGPCVVFIPSGHYSYATTIKIGEGQDLTGAGRSNTILHYAKNGDGIYWTSKVFQIHDPAGFLSKLSIICNNTTTACVHLAGINQPTLEDLYIAGASGPSGIGLLLEDIKSVEANGKPFATWMERIQIHNVDLGGPGRNNQTNLAFINNGGTGSFDYSDINLTMNVRDGGTGVLIGPSTDLFQVQFNVQGNINDSHGTSSTEALSVKGLLRYSRGFLGMEAGQGPNPKLIHVYRGGSVTFQGSMHIFPNGKDFNAVPMVDPGGFFEASPFLDFTYPNGVGDGNQTPFIQRAAKMVMADGTVSFASGNIGGLYNIEWPENNNTYQDIVVNVSCSFSNDRCQLDVLTNNAHSIKGPVINNLRIMAGGTGDSGFPQLVADITNRNGVQQDIFVSSIGASTVWLFPDQSVRPFGPTNVTREGLTVRDPSTSAIGGLSWQGGATIPSSSNVMQTPDKSPTGQCTHPSGYVSVNVNGVTLHLATCP
jgi:hypothetical protein